MTSADRTSSLARLQRLTTYCDDECAHKRRSQARRQSITGGCSPSDPASFTTNNHTFERTNIPKIIERTYPHTNISSHELLYTLGAEPKSYSCVSSQYQRSIIRQHSFSSYTLNIRRRRYLWTSAFITGTRFTVRGKELGGRRTENEWR